jgi:hypothetical protein
MALLTTAPWNSLNVRMPPANPLIAVARVEAMVRVTSAEGESGPWSIAATRQAPIRSASASVGSSPRQSLNSIAGNCSRPIASSRATPRTNTRSSVVAVMAVDQGSALCACPVGEP